MANVPVVTNETGKPIPAVPIIAVNAAGAAVSGLTGDSAPSTQPALRKTKALTIAAVSASASGDNTLIAATSGQTSRVHRLFLIAAGTVSIIVKRGSTALTGAIPLIANQGFILDFSAEPYFETAANEALNLNLSGAVAVTGWIEYAKSA